MGILRYVIAGIFLVCLFMRCADEDEGTNFEIVTYEYDFSQSDHGWQGGFSNYSTTDSVEDELHFLYTGLPPGLGSENALMFSANDPGGDLFMYMTKKVSGLRPDTEYTIAFDIEFASDVYSGLGPAATGVFLKTGATAIEPERILKNDIYQLNIDHGGHATEGSDMIIVGDISKDNTNTGYSIVTRNSTKASYHVRSDGNGELWLVIGIDSGFRGVTTVYFTNVSVVFSLSD